MKRYVGLAAVLMCIWLCHLRSLSPEKNIALESSRPATNMLDVAQKKASDE